MAIKLTVDIIVTIEGKEIILIKRTKEPFMDKLVLPGGHVEEFDEDLVAAALREVSEEIGLREIKADDLKFVKILDRKDRDPRPDARRISVAFSVDVTKEQAQRCLVGSDAKEIVKREITSFKNNEIGFDHMEAIETMLKLREKEANEKGRSEGVQREIKRF